MESILENIKINTQSSIHINGKDSIYFDPYQVEKDSHDADIILITHEHFDHFSPEDIEKVAKEDTVYIVPKSMHDSIKKTQVDDERIYTMEPGDVKVIKGMKVEAVPAYNINKEFHPKGNGWLGFVITVDNTRIYVSGDMDATPESKQVKCDIAMIPIGGYYTMDLKEAAAYINEIQPKIAIPTHYGTIVGNAECGREFKKLINGTIQVKILL